MNHRSLRLANEPDSLGAWVADMWSHRNVLRTLARADFHVRYKRAAFGVAWAVAVPVVQAGVLAIVFSKLIRGGPTDDFAAYVLAGVLAWSYFAQTIAAASTSIVDGSGLAEKVWFPRAVLVLVPPLAGLRAFMVSVAALLVTLIPLGTGWRPSLVLLPVATLVLVVFTMSLALVLAAMHVYFRDVKFLVQAGLLVLFYVTPIAYPKPLLGPLAGWADFNPLTGIVELFHFAVVGRSPGAGRSIVFSLLATLALVVAAVEVHRRHDRLFVDLL